MGRVVRSFYLILAILVAAALLFWKPLYRAAQANYAGWVTAGVLLGARPAVFPNPTLERLASENCRLNWFQAALAGQRSDLQSQRAAWIEAMGCSPGYISMIRSQAPTDMELARQAVRQQPNNALGWFWLAELISESEPELAIDYYRRGLEIDFLNGWAWVKLGRLLREKDPNGSRDAFRQACYLGDPGLHGCYNAGLLSEQLGDLSSAIRYYQASNLDRSKQRLIDLLEPESR